MPPKRWAVLDLDDMPGDLMLLTRWRWYAELAAHFLRRRDRRRMLTGQIVVMKWPP